MSEQFSGMVKIVKDGLFPRPTITLDGNTAVVQVGGQGEMGNITLEDKNGTTILRLGRDSARIRGFSPYGDQVFAIMQNGDMYLGGNGFDGDITLRSRDGEDRLQLDADQSAILVGGGNSDGAILLFGKDADADGGDLPEIHLDGERGALMVTGQITLRSHQDGDRIALSADEATVWVGGNQKNGHILLYPEDVDPGSGGDPNIHLDGEQGQIMVKGDIILAGADTAEKFTVQNPDQIHPGTVVVLNDSGNLTPSGSPYDSRVAGVISGAGETRPGLILNGLEDEKSKLPVALNGKVYCQVNTENGPVRVGDLLTTSSQAGFAMKADNPRLAFGAVLGKAMQPLLEGEDLLPILVALQ